MNNQCLIYFGNRLSQDDYDDDETRGRVLASGVEAVSRITGTRLGQRLDVACAVVVTIVTEEAREELERVLPQLQPPAELSAREDATKSAFSACGGQAQGEKLDVDPNEIDPDLDAAGASYPLNTKGYARLHEFLQQHVF